MQERSEDERNRIVQVFFQKFIDEIMSNVDEFGVGYVHALLVIKKDIARTKPPLRTRSDSALKDKHWSN